MAFDPKALGIPTTEEEADAINAGFELNTLRELALEFNARASELERIDLNRVKTKLEFIISLWQREVKIPETITFGEPYDSYFSSNRDEVVGTHYSYGEERVNGEYIVYPNSIDKNILYVMLLNP